MNRWAIFARPSGIANSEFVLPGHGRDWRPPQSFQSKTRPLGILGRALSESQTTRNRPEGFLDGLRGTTSERVLRKAHCPIANLPVGSMLG
jgi:hypothetical protein